MARSGPEGTPQSYKPPFWNQRRSEIAVGSAGLALTAGVTGVLLFGPHGVMREPGATQAAQTAGVTRLTDQPQPDLPTRLSQAPERPFVNPTTPAVEMQTLPQEPVLQAQVCDPLLKEITDRLSTSRVDVKPDTVLEGRSIYTVTREIPAAARDPRRRVTITTAGAGDKNTLDVTTVKVIQATLEELGTGEVNSDNPEGNTRLAGVQCFKSGAAGGREFLEATGVADGGDTQFNTQNTELYDAGTAAGHPDLGQHSVEQAQIATRATQAILARLTQ